LSTFSAVRTPGTTTWTLKDVEPKEDLALFFDGRLLGHSHDTPEKRAGLANGSVYFGCGRVQNGNNDLFDLEDNSGKFAFNFSDTTPAFHVFSTTNAYNQTNVPIHIGFRFASGDSNTACFYSNGVRVAGIWTTAASNVRMVPYPLEPFRIGSTYAGSTPRCRISEVAIWNTTLNDDEFAALAKAGRRGTPLMIRRAPADSLVLYAPLDGEFEHGVSGSGTNMVRDFGPNRFNLTPLSSPKCTRPAFRSTQMTRLRIPSHTGPSARP